MKTVAMFFLRIYLKTLTNARHKAHVEYLDIQIRYNIQASEMKDSLDGEINQEIVKVKAVLESKFDVNKYPA